MADLNSTIVRGKLRVTEDITTDGTLYLTKATDLSGTANNHPALMVGGTDTAAHLELDVNDIHAKASGTTVAPLYLNSEGGNTYLSGEKTYSDGTYLYSNSKKVSLEGHDHDGRYLKWNGSAADVNAMGWGTLTSANGYTILSHCSSSDGGD